MPERSKWTAVAWAAVAAAVVFAAVRMVGAGGAAAPPPVRVEHEPTGRERTTGRGGEPGGLYVHVAGAVRRPGLYRVAEGSRVAAALDAAGGPSRRAEVAAVNLAAPVEDGQQVVVPRRGAGAPAGAAAASTAGGAGGPPGAQGAPVSLATATVEQLDGLDGFGPTLAQRILAFRDRNGGVRSLEQLREVEGIGDKRFETLKESLRP